MGFRDFANRAAGWMGSPWAFLSAFGLVLVWGLAGPFFRYSQAWQMVANTVTTLVTFLLVFLVQSTQNRDARALHLKLDELVRVSTARNVFADLENATEDDMKRFEVEFRNFREKHAGVVQETGPR